ncbi:MAG: sigma-54-dependent Fis family transcriptional regulator, partial [Methylacidiphilales bacterium]|nr:sigma-54-dependent Fis family transcriptional regulator [Candidatus Methylacidiphilales bacterium]
ARDAAERREIERALRDSGGQVGEAAKRLGIARTTLWERMRRLSIRSR